MNSERRIRDPYVRWCGRAAPRGAPYPDLPNENKRIIKAIAATLVHLHRLRGKPRLVATVDGVRHAGPPRYLHLLLSSDGEVIQSDWR